MRRRRAWTAAVFVLLCSMGGTLLPVREIKAASCVLQGNTITSNCEFEPGTYYYSGTLAVEELVTVTAGSTSSPGLVTIYADDFNIDGVITANGMGPAGGSGSCPGNPTGATDGSGACHGGNGGRSTVSTGGGTPYGDAVTPIALGSGGGDDNQQTGQQGGRGGGAIHLATYSATGTMSFGQLAAITANGANGTANEAGGGSGGSVWLEAGTMTGTLLGALVSANGGNGVSNAPSSVGGGGGGGGRVAIHYTEISGPFGFTAQAYGGGKGTTGAGAQVGGAGTVVFWDLDEAHPSLYVNNNNQSDTPLTRQTDGVDYTVLNFAVQNGAKYQIDEGETLTVASGGTFIGGSAAGQQPALNVFGTFNAPSEELTISAIDVTQSGTVGNLRYLNYENGVYTLTTSTAAFSAGPGNRLEGLTVSGTSSYSIFTVNSTEPLYLDALTVKSGAVLTHATNTNIVAHTLTVSATSTISVESGGRIDVTRKGYAVSEGPGQGADGSSRVAGGGGHGGDGGDSGLVTTVQAGGSGYGSITEPTTLGSGGGNDTLNSGNLLGRGGGAIKLTAGGGSGTITIDGTVSAEGGDAQQVTVDRDGGGAGGSVWIDVPNGTLAGSGTVTVEGGDGYTQSATSGSGGGGGGRIALYYSGSHALTLKARGGLHGASTTPAKNGGAGSIYEKAAAETNGNLTFDNENQSATSALSRHDSPSSLMVKELSIRNDAHFLIPAGLTLSLEAGTGSVTGGSSGGNSPSLRVDGVFDPQKEEMTISGLDLHQDGTIGTLRYLAYDNGIYQVYPATAQFSAGPGNRLETLTLSGTNSTIFQTTGLGTFFIDVFRAKSGSLVTHATNTTSHAHSLVISATTSIDVDSGASVDVKGRGYLGSAGAGRGPGGPGAGGYGGGYGGNGGGISSTPGGVTYGSVKEPTDIGSSGSEFNGLNGSGGNGGGAVKLESPGTITLNGTVTAAGNNGVQIAGGGSGGSVWIDAGTLAGSGSISANGGNCGCSNNSGGGGGGRIAIYYNADSSSLARTAFGGTRAFNGVVGGAGSIFLDDKDDGNANGELIIDNNNQTASATTQVTTASQSYDAVTIRRGANYVIPNGHALTLPPGGAVASDGSTKPTVTINSGGTLDPNASSWSVDNLNIANSGTVATVTSLDYANATFTLSGTGGFGAALSTIVLASATFTQGSSNPGAMSVTSLSMTSSTYNNNSSNPGLDLAALTIPSGSTFNNNSSAYYPLGAGFLDLMVYGTYSEGVMRRLFVDELIVQSGGLVTHAQNAGSSSQDKALDISATSTISILEGGSVSVAGRGYLGTAGAGRGPGGPVAGGLGGSYGGNGGHVGNAANTAPTYGSVKEPTDIGSSGSEFNGLNGSGGSGGGAIKLETPGTLLVAGTLSANGGNGTGIGGGGSGGSVWLDAGALTGGGTISAIGGNRGGSNVAGGGGGGRIAIYYLTDSSTGTRIAYGGTRTLTALVGGAGTIFTDDKDDGNADGELFIDNNDQTSSAATTQVTTASQSYDAVTIRRGAQYVIPNGFTLGLPPGGAITTGGTATPSITINSGGTLDPNTSTWSISGLNIINSGTIPPFLELTVGSGSNWRQQSTAPLFSGSELVIEGTFTQEHTTTIEVDTVTVKSGGLLTHCANVSTKACVVDFSTTTFTVESGGSVNVNNKGYSVVQNQAHGPGAGTTGTQAGGGGYGGSGGQGSGGQAGGGTYGSEEEPDELGSGGGDDTNASGAQGGAGGGAIKLVATGTFTNDGTITANGQDATANEGGGGAGGSIWLVVGTLDGSCAWTANGGKGSPASGSAGGGGGGGGRISFTYAAKTCSGTPAVTGGGKGGTTSAATAGEAGTIFEFQDAPTIDFVAHSPAAPEVGDNVHLSCGASKDSGGVTKIELFLDGTGPGNLKKTCNFSPAETPAFCDVSVGSLSAGSHTATCRATDNNMGTAEDTDVFDVVSRTSENRVFLSSQKKSATNVGVTISMTFAAPSSGTLTVTFPSDFVVTSAATDAGSDDCFSSFGFTSSTLTAAKTGCSGTVVFGGATVTNPSTAGQYVITWTNDNGSSTVTIVEDGDFNISAAVAATISFNVGAQTGACDGTFSGNGGTVALGTLSSGAVASSDVSGVAHVCIRASANASSGAVVTVRSENAALRSLSVPADEIPSSSATLTAGTAGYGLCVGSGGGDTGTDTTTPASSPVVRSSPFNGACSTSSHAVGGLTTSPQSLWSFAGPSQNAFARVFVKAAIAPTTAPHDDYTDTLTFILTGTY